jgi:hypothetical protein
MGECLDVSACVGRTQLIVSQNTADRDAGHCEYVLVRTVGPLAIGILSAILCSANGPLITGIYSIQKVRNMRFCYGIVGLAVSSELAVKLFFCACSLLMLMTICKPKQLDRNLTSDCCPALLYKSKENALCGGHAICLSDCL